MATDNSSKDLFTERQEVPAEYWRIASAGIIDAAFAIFCVVLLYRLQQFAPIAFLIDTINATVLVLMLLIIYRLITITFFSGTFGMFLLKITFLNGEDQRLTFVESLLASVFILYAGVNYYNR